MTRYVGGMSAAASRMEEDAEDATRSSFTRMGRVMTARKLTTKHELKTRETREQLLKAAETIFARDGYQGAELGEIAALAGRTKGAIYAQFASKEEVFLALIEENRQRYRAKMEALLAESTTIEGNLEALRSFYQNMAENRTWRLLLLEFKLFAIRHPESKARLQGFMDESLSVLDEERIAAILGPAPEGGVSRVAAVLSMQPVVSALSLEWEFAGSVGQEALKKVVDRVFDALLGGGSRD
jgi:AcrR family transcriptional regulator